MVADGFLEAKQKFFSSVFKDKISNPKEVTVFEREKFLKSLDEEVDSFVQNNKMGEYVAYRECSAEEINSLFESLKKSDHDSEQFWFVCYGWCLLLAYCYGKKLKKIGGNEGEHAEYIYDKPEAVSAYEGYCEQIKAYLKTGSFPSKHWKTRLLDKIKSDWDVLMLEHSTPLKNRVGFMNLYRLVFVFARFTVTQMMLLAKELKWIEKVERLWKVRIDVDKIVKRIAKPTAVFNALSISFFAARFIINTGIVLKHALFEKKDPSLTEEQRSLNRQAEYQRFCTMLNDAVWFTINGLCNYRQLFGIAAPLANWLTAGFLAFDVALLVFRHFYVARNEYLLKKSLYMAEFDRLNNPQQQGVNSSIDVAKQRQMLLNQMVELDNNWKAANFTCAINITAASVLLCSFSAALIFSGPIAFVVSGVFCSIGLALYLSAESGGVWKKAALDLKQFDELNKEDKTGREDLVHNLERARRQFFINLVKHTVIPLIIVATLATNLAAGLLVVAAYMLWEYLPSFDLSKKNTNSGQQASLEDNNQLELKSMSLFGGSPSEEVGSKHVDKNRSHSLLPASA